MRSRRFLLFNSYRDIPLTASYLGVERTTTLAVTLPSPRASFTVTSRNQGSDKCEIVEEERELDCRLDSSASDGRLTTWPWVLEAKNRITANRSGPVLNEIDMTCSFVEGATSSSDSVGTYVNMTVSLQVPDRDGTQSATTTKTIRLYPNNKCGF